MPPVVVPSPPLPPRLADIVPALGDDEAELAAAGQRAAALQRGSARRVPKALLLANTSVPP